MMPLPLKQLGARLHNLWHKVWADLWLAKARSIMAIINIAVGVFSVGTIFGMIDLELTKLDAAHQLSQPSHISLLLRNDASIDLLEQIKSIKGVAGVDILTQLTVPYHRAGESDWQMATLMIRPDYNQQHFDITTLKSGDWPDSQHITIENLSANDTLIQSGDTIDFATDNGSISFAIQGIVRHPFIKPPKFGGQVHFFADASILPLLNIPSDSFRQLLVQTTPPYSAEQARSVAHELRVLLNNNHIAVNATLLQDPIQHWGRAFFKGVNLVLQIMAFASLALASVLILNTVTAHLEQQTQQIGIMKSLGASTITLVRLYLTEISILAILAIVLALPGGLWAAYFSSCQLLALFNVPCNDFAYSQRAVSFMLIGGMLVPLLAAIVPIVRAATMTVRIAIASYGLGTNYGKNRCDLWIEQIGARLLPTIYAAALGNLFRRKMPLLLTQSVLIIAGVTFLVLMSLMASLNLTLEHEMARSRYALRLSFTRDQEQQTIQQLVKSQFPDSNIESWQRLPVEMTKNNLALQQKGSLGIQLLAVPAASKLYQPLIETGRWLQAADAGQRVLVLSAETAELNALTVGDSVDLSLGQDQQAWQLIGTYRWLAGNNFSVEPAYTAIETVQNITQHHDKLSFALVEHEIANIDQETDFLQSLKQLFQSNDIALDVYNTVAKLKQNQFAHNQFKPVLGTLFGLAVMIATVAGIGLSGLLAISVLQRTREIGVLRAIGAPSQAIFRLFLMEGLLHGLFAWLLSVPLAYLCAEPIAKKLGKTMLGIQLDYDFAWLAVIDWLIILVIIVAMAAYWPARKAAKLTVRECLA